MAIQLNASNLRRSFQLLVTLGPCEMTQDVAFERASNLIYSWGWRKLSRIFTLMPNLKSSFDDKKDGNEVGSIYDPENGCFYFRISHPDVSIAGRIWVTDVQLSRNDDNFVFAVRLSTTSFQSCTEDVPFSCPQFVRQIAQSIGISDVIKVEGTPTLLATRNDVDCFLTFLEDEKRCMPAILLTPCYHSEDAMYEDYMMDAVQMAKDLLGIAHVFRITTEANEYLTSSVGKSWSAFNGTVRTYYPGASFKTTDYYHHPLLTQQSLRYRSFLENDDPQFCMHEIEEYVQNYMASRRFIWEENGVDFYLTANQKYLRAQRNAKEQSRDEIISSYEEQLAQLQQKSDENLFYAESFSKDADNYKARMDEQSQLIHNLKGQVSALRACLKGTKGEADNQEIPTDGSYADMAEWASQCFPDRLVLLSRAERSLKDACYENVVLVYKCLRLLALEYYDYCMGLINYDTFINACRTIDAGLEERGAITDVAAGMQADEYYVQYHGKRRKLERHLVKGNSKDPRYCLRIYYFWDDQEQIVVIGDLPHHLDTEAT